MTNAEVEKKMEHLAHSLDGALDLLSGDIWYADKVLYREDVTDALNDAYRSVTKAIDLLKGKAK